MSAVTSTLPTPPQEGAKADRIGVIASVLCAIHCAVTPLLLLFAPVFGEIWAHPASHWIVALFVVPLALVMVLRGFRVHRKRWIVATGLLGMGLVIFGAIIPYLPEAEESGPTATAEASVTTGEDAAAEEEFVWVADEMADAEADTEEFVWNVGDELPEADGEVCASTDGSGEPCLDSCCPSLITDSEGNTKLHIPAASIVTTLGGVALICTHLGNLCACRRRKDHDSCGSHFC